jgi:glycosyltransferase involved in cell wall biosynthesis
MNVEPVPAADRLRIAVLGDFDGIHTRSWLRWFIARGHDLHCISYYPPSQPIDGVTMHVLRDRAKQSTPSSAASVTVPAASRLEGLKRLANGLRYRRAGLQRKLREIAPDVFHAHFVVEHGFYGALAAVHPYAVTAWGSDILVEPRRDPVSRRIAKWTLARAELITSNNKRMADEITALGVPPSKIEVVTLGADAYFGEHWEQSVNVAGRSEGAPTILSTRAHEPLYNIDVIIDAFAAVTRSHPPARLAIAHSGSLTTALRARAENVPGIKFTSTVDEAALRDLMMQAEVFVSVPSSDGTSVALLQAMSAGCFPIVADLETQREWIADGENGLLVPPRDPVALGAAIERALGDTELRRSAAAANRDIVRERGTNETQMAKVEQLFLRLGGREHA